MPPEQRPIPRFVAEPPHDALPYGRWADQLRGLFLEACREIEGEDDIGEPGDISWFPERTFNGRTYIPATAPTSEGFEVFGYVAFEHGPGGEPASFLARADYTDETAAANADWKLDLSDEEIDVWRGPRELSANVALVWGVALVPGGALATADGPVRSGRGPLHARVAGRLDGRPARGAAVGRRRQRAGVRIALRRGLTDYPPREGPDSSDG
jgi:hypothetical protein